MYCVQLISGTVRVVTRVTSVDACPAAANLPTGSTSTGYLLLLEPVDIPVNPLWVSASDAGVYSTAVMGVWLLAWCWRRYQQVLNGPAD